MAETNVPTFKNRHSVDHQSQMNVKLKTMIPRENQSTTLNLTWNYWTYLPHQNHNLVHQKAGAGSLVLVFSFGVRCILRSGNRDFNTDVTTNELKANIFVSASFYQTMNCLLRIHNCQHLRWFMCSEGFVSCQFLSIGNLADVLYFPICQFRVRLQDISS